MGTIFEITNLFMNVVCRIGCSVIIVTKIFLRFVFAERKDPAINCVDIYNCDDTFCVVLLIVRIMIGDDRNVRLLAATECLGFVHK